MAGDVYQETDWLAEAGVEELRRTVDALHRVHRLMSVITDLDTLLCRIIEESKAVAEAEASSLMLYDSVSEELYFHVAIGERGDQQALKREVRLKVGQGIAGAAAEGLQAVVVNDVTQDARFYRGADAASHFETRGLLAVPLLDRNRLVGVLEVVNKLDGAPFTALDTAIMEMFGALAATAIANARLIEENLRAERLSAIGEAVAGLSHYTKNMIMGVGGSVELIDEGLEKGDLKYLRQSWPILKRSTNRITNFVEDMLAFSKPRKPVYEDCDVRELVRDVEETFWGLLAQRHVKLHTDVGGVEDRVKVDVRGLFRCLLNLLTNAAEALPKTGGNIWLLAQTTGGGELLIVVSDDGPGVPADQASRIFEPFYSTKGSRGTGLGLAVTRKIVMEHGGTIEVGTRDHGGALFRIVVPVGTSGLGGLD